MQNIPRILKLTQRSVDDIVSTALKESNEIRNEMVEGELHYWWRCGWPGRNPHVDTKHDGGSRVQIRNGHRITGTSHQ